jgi:hypothetical protein
MNELLRQTGLIGGFVHSTSGLEQPEELHPPELPVLVTARFELLDNGAIALLVSGVNAPRCFLSVIHEGRESRPPQVIRGDQTAKAIFVRDAESVMILARYEGTIIANALFEVRPELIGSIGKFANPAATFNMIVEQVNMAGSVLSIVSANKAAPASDETVRVSAVKIVGGAR